MKRHRTSSFFRMMIAALAVLLSGCGDGTTILPSSITGNWLTVAVNPGGSRMEDRLELTADGFYVWTTAAFGPQGRAEDGMLWWHSRSGDWRVEGDRLALRTTSGMAWEQGSAVVQLEYDGEWNRDHRLRLQSDHLLLQEVLPPEMSRTPRSYAFDRAVGVLDD
jgi:hypothetical protein